MSCGRQFFISHKQQRPYQEFLCCIDLKKTKQNTNRKSPSISFLLNSEKCLWSLLSGSRLCVKISSVVSPCCQTISALDELVRDFIYSNRLLGFFIIVCPVLKSDFTTQNHLTYKNIIKKKKQQKKNQTNKQSRYM